MKARLRRAEVSAFKEFITTPATGTITMPAGAVIVFKAKALSAAGEAVATIVSKSTVAVKSKGLPLGGYQKYDWIAPKSVVTVNSNFDMYLENNQGTLVKICGGV
jgi:hypothetical protein